MSQTHLPELHTEEARQALAELALATLERWGVQEPTQAELLGLRAVAPLQEGEPLPDRAEVLERVGHLLAIDRSLATSFGGNLAARDHWIACPLPELSGLTPLAVMLQGIDGLRRVHGLVEPG